MSKRVCRLFALAATPVAALGLAACGSGSGDVVAQVGGSPITVTAVNHWMTALATSDYYRLSHRRTPPTGLVSDPPNYAGCVTHLRAVAVSPRKKSANPAALRTKCRQLYQALKLQAMRYLVQARWLISLERELGMVATDGEVLGQFKRTQPEHYLATVGPNLSDQLLDTKLAVLGQKSLHQIETDRRALSRFVEAAQRWTARTSCHVGYVVEHCKQYTGALTKSATPSAAVLIEQVVSLATGICIDRRACAEK